MIIPKPSETFAPKKVNLPPVSRKREIKNKPFVVPEHLTTKAFKNHGGLKALKDTLVNPKK